MSCIVYAGSAQMVAVGLLAAGEPLMAIVVTTFILNLRHLLMSTVLSPKVRHWPVPLQVALGSELTDETFSLLSTRFSTSAKIPRKYAFGVNHSSHLSWILGSLIGHTMSGFIVDVKAFGLDYALVAMLISLLALQARTPRKLIVAATSGSVAVMGTLLGVAHVSVILATLAAATLGLMWERQCPAIK